MLKRILELNRQAMELKDSLDDAKERGDDDFAADCEMHLSLIEDELFELEPSLI